MVKAMSRMQLLIVNLLLLVSLAVNAAEIQVAVDRNPVSLKDSFQITFTADQEPDGNPDFSPLQENFDILDQQRSSNSSWVNGQSSRTEQWILSVMAKQTGEFLIPPIAFGADSSKPLRIKVSETQVAPQSNEDLFLEVTATPEKPYKQSQVIYTVRLYTRLQIAQGVLNDPDIKNTVVEKLGEDGKYTTQIAGINYSVIERKYAVFPQQPGPFTIPPLTLNAQVMVQGNSRFNSFFNQQSTEARRVMSKAINLDVQAIPDSFKSPDWLSAESVRLKEVWSDHSRQTTVGEPLTRTRTLTVHGATVDQLPELSNLAAIDGIKTYPDQPVLKEDKQSDGLTAVREEKVAFIPSKSGDYTLPALEISWFNTKTQQVEKASLPSIAIKALVSNEKIQQTPAIPSGTNQTVIQTEAPSIAKNGEMRYWQALSAFLALGWLLTTAGHYLRKQKIATPSVAPSVHLAESVLEKNLKHACWENNPHAVQLNLLQWGKIHFGADSLATIAKLCPEPLRDEIEQLNLHLYSGQQQAWKGENLWQSFSKTKLPTSVEPVGNEVLEPLFKL
jgi:hypothetical protein